MLVRSPAARPRGLRRRMLPLSASGEVGKRERQQAALVQSGLFLLQNRYPNTVRRDSREPGLSAAVQGLRIEHQIPDWR
ncbi:hypothetical protein NN561_007181 [Cricetulus griseus]